MKLFDTIKSYISLEEEDEDSLYEAEMRELERKERSKNVSRSESSRKSRRSSVEDFDDEEEDIKPASKRTPRSSFSERKYSERGKSSMEKESVRPQTANRRNYDSSRITPPRSPESTYSPKKNPYSVQRKLRSDDNIVKMHSDASEITILKLQTLADAQEVCDSLMEGRPIIVSFEDPRGPEAQRIMDFVSGCLYVMNGNLHTISDSIFLFSPKGVDVSGDYLNMMQNSGFGIPTFNKMM